MSSEIYDSDFDDQFQEQQVKRESTIQKGKRKYMGNFEEQLTDPEEILNMHQYQVVESHNRQKIKKTILFHNSDGKVQNWKSDTNDSLHQSPSQQKKQPKNVNFYHTRQRGKKQIKYVEKEEEESEYQPPSHIKSQFRKMNFRRSKLEGPQPYTIMKKYEQTKMDPAQREEIDRRINEMEMPVLRYLFHKNEQKNEMVDENQRVKLEERNGKGQSSYYSEKRDNMQMVEQKMQIQERYKMEEPVNIFPYNEEYQNYPKQEQEENYQQQTIFDRIPEASIPQGFSQEQIYTEQQAPQEGDKIEITKDNIQQVFKMASLNIKRTQYIRQQGQDPFYDTIFKQIKRDLQYKQCTEKSSHHLSKGKLYMVRKVMESYAHIPPKECNAFVRDRQTKKDAEYFKQANLERPPSRLTTVFLSKLFENRNFAQYFRQFSVESNELMDVLRNKSVKEILNFGVFYNQIGKSHETLAFKMKQFKTLPHFPLSHLEIQLYMEQAHTICQRYCQPDLK